MNYQTEPLSTEVRGRPEAAWRWAARGARRIDALLATRLRGSPRSLRDPSERLLRSGGKRIRPALLLLCARAAGPRLRGVSGLAAAAEAVHGATLLHDDVIDDAAERRGIPAARATFGNAAAVLAGDHLLAIALELVLRAELPGAVGSLVEAIRAMVEAEGLQLQARREPVFDADRCLEICRGKTASLFRWCAAVGAAAGGGSEGQVRALAELGERVGIAFQLRDDLLELASPRGIAEDLRQGAYTLPMVLAAAERKGLGARLAAAADRVRGGESDPEALERIAAEIAGTGAPARVRETIGVFTAAALASLSALDHSPAREALASLVRSLAVRGS